jgi:uncharacterized membrane protein YoaK (UPF0700 family)
LARPVLGVQFVLLVAVLIFSVLTRPSTNPHGLIAGVAAMMAVSAMAYQYALLRLALPKVVSTSVMTGNLTNAVLSLIEMLLARGLFEAADFGTEKLVVSRANGPEHLGNQSEDRLPETLLVTQTLWRRLHPVF